MLKISVKAIKKSGSRVSKCVLSGNVCFPELDLGYGIIIIIITIIIII